MCGTAGPRGDGAVGHGAAERGEQPHLLQFMFNLFDGVAGLL